MSFLRFAFIQDGDVSGLLLSVYVFAYIYTDLYVNVSLFYSSNNLISVFSRQTFENTYMFLEFLGFIPATRMLIVCGFHILHLNARVGSVQVLPPIDIVGFLVFIVSSLFSHRRDEGITGTSAFW